MNYEKLEKIYSETVADMPAEQIDFLQFIAYKAYGITEQDVRTYASRNGLNPGTVRKWKRNFEDKELIKCIPSEGWNYIISRYSLSALKPADWD